MKYTVIGCDPASAKSVAVVLTDEGYDIHVFTTKAKDMPTRAYEQMCWMRGVVRTIDGPVVLYLERPVFSRGGLKALLPLGETQGSIAAGAVSAGATVVRVSPAEWKKAVIGNGNAGKLKIKLYLKKHWLNFYLESEGDIDVCDAGAIALFGRKKAGANQGVKVAPVKSVGRTRGSPVLRRSVSASPRVGAPTLAKNSKSKKG